MRTQDPGADSAVADGGLGRRLVAALAAKDARGLRALFAGEVDFRAMTPGRLWEARTPAGVVDEVILGTWFGPDDVIEKVEAVETGMVADRIRLGYRLRVSNPDGAFLVEQQAFFDVTSGAITWMRVLCSGFRSVASTMDHAAK